MASSPHAKHVSVTYFLLEVGTPYDFVCGEPQLYSRTVLSNVVGIKSNHVTACHKEFYNISLNKASQEVLQKIWYYKKGIIALSNCYIFKKGCM